MSDLQTALRSHLSWKSSLLKRSLDLCLSLPLTISLIPCFAAISLAIKLETNGPVFFRQKRRGKAFKEFTINKFRSLRHNEPDPNDRYEIEAADPRITRVGAFLRRTSLDETPQLLNVIIGTMSLIGPRPLVEWESQICLTTHPQRFTVKPGITGLSQITVRNSVGLSARSDMDVQYVKEQSIWLDAQILMKTVMAVVSPRSVYPHSKERCL